MLSLRLLDTVFCFFRALAVFCQEVLDELVLNVFVCAHKAILVLLRGFEAFFLVLPIGSQLVRQGQGQLELDLLGVALGVEHVAHFLQGDRLVGK